jgi:hypothetical protein
MAFLYVIMEHFYSEKSVILKCFVHRVNPPHRERFDSQPVHAVPQPDLKELCHDIFCFWFFSWISFPKFATGVNDAGGKFATGVIGTGGKQWEQYQAADNLK